MKTILASCCPVIILFVVTPRTTHAQLLPLHHYTTQNGLISNWVTSVIQDSGGYLWVGTSDGMSVYDGAGFVNYTTEDGLSNSFITVIKESRRHPGAIWIGTIQRGLTKYEGGKFRKLHVGATLYSNTITSLAEDTSGTLWCATPGGVFRVKEDTAREFLPKEMVHRTAHVAATSNGLIWIGTGRLVRIYGTNGRITGSIELPLGADEHVESMSVDREGDVWIGGTSGTLLLYRDATLVGKRSLSSAIAGVLVDHQRFAWLTTGKGIQKIRKDTFPHGPAVLYGEHRGLPEQGVFAAIEDREGNIWFGTYHKGLIKLSERALHMIPVRAYTHMASVDVQGRLWLPAENGLWEVWAEGEEQYCSEFHALPGMTGTDQGSPVVFDLRGRLWMVSDRSLRCYEVARKANGGSRLVHVTSFSPFSKLALAAHVDRSNRLWYSSDSIVVVVDLSTSARLERYFRFPRDIPLGSVRAIYQDVRGNIWLGDFQRGLVRLEANSLPRQDQSRRSVPMRHFTMADGLPDDGIRSFSEDDAGRLWIGTRYGGVAVYDGSTFTTISIKDGLVSNCIWSMARDSTGRMWLATSLGLMVLNKDASKKVMRETVGRTIDFCAASRSGQIWFGTGLESLGAYDTGKQAPNLVSPLIHISQFVVNDSAVSTESELEFSFDRNNCTIHYIGISLKDEQSVRYQFRLNNAEWSKPTRQRSVSFAALSPGEYSFEVRALNGDGIVSQHPARLAFTILPPFWQRWWFVLLVAILLGAFVYVAYLYRVRQLLQVERLRARIATDLHDDIGASLTRIALFSDIARDEARSAAPKLTDVAERIGNDARELLDAVSTLVWSIDPRHDSFDDVLTYMKEFAQEMFDMKGIAYSFSSEAELGSLQLPVETRRSLLLLYKEAVNNVVKHSQCTETRVEIASRGGDLVLSVTDNGRGFSERATGEGHGIANMQTRAAALGARFSIVSGEGKGTRVQVIIPSGTLKRR